MASPPPADPDLGRPPLAADGEGRFFGRDGAPGGQDMHTFDAIVERDPDTGPFVGSAPGWPGAHGQGATRDELEKNLREVLEMLLEDGQPRPESEPAGLPTIRIA